MRLPEEIVIHRIGVYRALSAPCLRGSEFMPQPVGEPRDDLVLHVEEIGDQLIEALRPEMRAGFGLNQLDIDTHAVSSPLDAALQHIANIQIAADLLEINVFALKREGCVASDHEGATDA